MLMEGRIILRASIERVWERLLDAETLVSCIPGAEKIERIDERTYDCVVKQKVGPISVKFKFKSVLTKTEPPRHLEIDGEDIAKAGHFVQKSIVDLRETGAVEGGKIARENALKSCTRCHHPHITKGEHIDLARKGVLPYP